MQVIQKEIKIEKKNDTTKKDLHLAQFEDETAILKYRYSSFMGKTPFRESDKF